MVRKCCLYRLDCIFFFPAAPQEVLSHVSCSHWLSASCAVARKKCFRYQVSESTPSTWHYTEWEEKQSLFFKKKHKKTKKEAVFVLTKCSLITWKQPNTSHPKCFQPLSCHRVLFLIPQHQKTIVRLISRSRSNVALLCCAVPCGDLMLGRGPAGPLRPAGKAQISLKARHILKGKDVVTLW